MRFGVLGPVTVTEGTTALSIGGPKQRTVLAMLIAHAGDAVAADSIIQAVWGDEAAPNARRIAQTYVATLRAEVGDAIVKAGQGWRLDVSRDHIDAAAFEDLYTTARDALEANPQRASVALREALAMWRGRPYADIEAHGALDGETHRLTELRLAAQATRIDADLALGRDADLIGEIEANIAEHPYSERFRAQHMLALYRAGRQQEALRSYGQLRTVLLEELGVDPTPELQDLERRILEQDDSLRAEPTQTIQRRAILVADPGDPIEIGHLPSTEREELLSRTTRAVRNAIQREGDGLAITAGTTTYVVFDSALTAANVAEMVTRRLDGQAMRMAIDWGDMVLENGRVSGPPVSRAAVMAAVAHKGQVLLSVDAQQAIGTSGSGRGLRFENLGSYDLHGVEGSLLIYQLLVGEVPPVFPDLQIHRLPPPLPGGGDRSVPGYELREALGPGSVGTLYRAFQPSVGREVLIEVIGRADSSEADFVRNFEADAQRLSLVDHQNIAPVIDYWRQPDGAFLVYRLPRGGLLSQGPTVDAVNLVEQIGSALSYAHSLGMTHGSVRPDRIALDEAGNASLLCFPIAGAPPGEVDEYVEYVAPEPADGEPPRQTADIFALGVLARELGLEHPVIDRACSVDPDERPATVAEFLVDLNPSGSDSPADRYTETRNPYKGLAAFHERDASDFFGRAAATDELCRALGRSHLLSIVGPSGIGKSSVARAGLIPALRAGRLPGAEAWLITDMLPGSHPFFELQRALERVAVDLPIDLTESLAAQRPEALDDVAGVLPEGAQLVVLIDQFEELFTMVAETERNAFLDLLGTSIRNRSARFVLTMRADFLDRPLRYSTFGGLLKTSTVMLAAPTRQDLSDAIAKPAKGVGVEVAPELVERMVSEVHDQPGALPLLQHTLSELFTSRESDLIGVESFDELGGVSGSLARRAESIYSDLTGAEQSQTKQVFLRMVTIVDDSAPTRRRVRMTELDDLDAQRSIELFRRSRLLVFDSDPETRTPTVEVAHEALLTHWPRLAGWIEATREDLAFARRLDEARRDWEASDRDATYLLSGGRLAQHQAWTSSTSLVLSDRDREFLDASRHHDESLKARARRRRSWVMTGFAAAAVIALVFALSATRNAERAEAESLAGNAVLEMDSDPELGLLLALRAHEQSSSFATISAVRQGLQAQRTEMIIDPPDGSLGARAVIAPDGSRIAVVGEGTTVVQMWEPGGESPIWERTITDDPSTVFPTWSWVWFSSDGESIYIPLFAGRESGSPEAGLYTLEAETGHTRDFLAFPCILRAMPAGTQFVTGELFAFDWHDGCGPDGAGVVDIGTGEVIFEVDAYPGTPPTLSADGRFLSVEGGFPDDPTVESVRVFDVETGEMIQKILGRSAAVLSSDGSTILAGQDPTFLYDVGTGERLQTYQGDFLRFNFTPDGRRVVGNSSTGTTHIFDLDSGAELMTLRGHTGALRTFNLSADGRTLVTSAFDSARVWDVASPSRGEEPSIELDVLAGDRFYLDALSSSDDFILSRRAGIKQVTGVQQTIPYLIDVIDKRTGEVLWNQEVWAAELGPDGLMYVQPILEKDVVSPGGVEGSIHVGRPQLVDTGTGRVIRGLEGCDHYWIEWDDPEPGDGCAGSDHLDPFNLQFSADGSTLVAATWLGAVTVWDVATGSVVRESPPAWVDPQLRLQGYRWAAALSSDGSLLTVPSATEDQPAVGVEETRTEVEVGGFTTDRWVDYLMFEPHSGALVGSHTDLFVVDPVSWEVSTMTRSKGSLISDLALSPDGRLAATVSLDETVAVWDLEEQGIVTEFPVLGHIGEGMRGVAFLDDETLVAAPETGTQLLRFTLNAETLVELARERLTRGFRSEECATYDIDPCPTLEDMRSGS